MARTKRIFREWQHPRASNGRFARKGSPEWVKAAAEKFRHAEASLKDGTHAPGSPTRTNGGRPRIARGAKAEAAFAQHAPERRTNLAPHQPVEGPARPERAARKPVARAAKEVATNRQNTLDALSPRPVPPRPNTLAGMRYNFADGSDASHKDVVASVDAMNNINFNELTPGEHVRAGQAVARAQAAGTPGADAAAAKLRRIGIHVPKLDSSRDNGKSGGVTQPTTFTESDAADLRSEYMDLQGRLGMREGNGGNSSKLRDRIAEIERTAAEHGIDLQPPRRFGRKAAPAADTYERGAQGAHGTMTGKQAWGALLSGPQKSLGKAVADKATSAEDDRRDRMAAQARTAGALAGTKPRANVFDSPEFAESRDMAAAQRDVKADLEVPTPGPAPVPKIPVGHGKSWVDEQVDRMDAAKVARARPKPVVATTETGAVDGRDLVRGMRLDGVAMPPGSVAQGDLRDANEHAKRGELDLARQVLDRAIGNHSGEDKRSLQAARNRLNDDFRSPDTATPKPALQQAADAIAEQRGLSARETLGLDGPESGSMASIRATTEAIKGANGGARDYENMDRKTLNILATQAKIPIAQRRGKSNAEVADLLRAKDAENRARKNPLAKLSDEQITNGLKMRGNQSPEGMRLQAEADKRGIGAAPAGPAKMNDGLDQFRTTEAEYKARYAGYTDQQLADAGRIERVRTAGRDRESIIADLAAARAAEDRGALERNLAERAAGSGAGSRQTSAVPSGRNLERTEITGDWKRGGSATASTSIMNRRAPLADNEIPQDRGTRRGVRPTWNREGQGERLTVSGDARTRAASPSGLYDRHKGLTRAEFDALPETRQRTVIDELRRAANSGEVVSKSFRGGGRIDSPGSRALVDAPHVAGAKAKLRELTYTAPPPVDNSIEGRAARLKAGDRWAADGTLEELNAIARAAGFSGFPLSWKKAKAVEYLRNQAIAGDRRKATSLAAALRGATPAEALAVMDVRDADSMLTMGDIGTAAKVLGIKLPAGDKRKKMHALAQAVGAKGDVPKADAAPEAAPKPATTRGRIGAAAKRTALDTRRDMTSTGGASNSPTTEAKMIDERFTTTQIRAGEAGPEAQRVERNGVGGNTSLDDLKAVRDNERLSEAIRREARSEINRRGAAANKAAAEAKMSGFNPDKTDEQRAAESQARRAAIRSAVDGATSDAEVRDAIRGLSKGQLLRLNNEMGGQGVQGSSEDTLRRSIVNLAAKGRATVPAAPSQLSPLDAQEAQFLADLERPFLSDGKDGVSGAVIRRLIKAGAVEPTGEKSDDGPTYRLTNPEQFKRPAKGGPTAPAKSGEPQLGVTESSRGRTTTVTLPDGTTAQRTSKTMTYTHAVVGTTNLHARAARLRKEAEQEDASIKAMQQWLADGADKSKLKRHATSANGYHTSYQYEVPGATVRTYTLNGKEYPREHHALLDLDILHTRDTKPRGHVPPAEAVAKAVEQTRRVAQGKREQAAELEAGPQYSYHVPRWSQRADTAFKAIGSPEVNQQDTTYQVVTVGGIARQDAKPAKVVPTAAEKAAAKEAEKDAAKARREESNRKFVEERTREIEQAITRGDDNPAGPLQFTNEQATVYLAKQLGVKVPNRRQTFHGTPVPRSREEIDAIKASIVEKVRERQGKA